MNEHVYSNWETTHISANTSETKEDVIATEFPLTIMVNQTEFATIVCTPKNLSELVIGFLASEGIILFKSDRKTLEVDRTRGFTYVTLHKLLQTSDFDSSKRFIGSCCGKSRQFYFKNDVRTARTIIHSVSMTTKHCLRLMQKLQERSKYFKRTGGVHNAALCTTDNILKVRTDIGRHNTLDKLYGYIIENKVQVKNKIIVFSGRVSSEVLLKISKMRISMIISASAPTDLALRLADELGITVIGFTREEKMNVYTHKERIVDVKM